MATSSKPEVEKSEITQGDALVMAADMIKLLAPALKRATKGQVERLKKRSKEVQDVFVRMLAGEQPVHNHFCLRKPVVAFNKTKSKFRDQLIFEIKAEALRGYRDSFEITICFLGYEHEVIFSQKMTKHVNWLGDCDAYVSVSSVNLLKSEEDIWTLRNRIQASLLLEKLTVTFFEVEDRPDLCRMQVKADDGFYNHVHCFRVEDIGPLLERE